jgi:hypothetical protein
MAVVTDVGMLRDKREFEGHFGQAQSQRIPDDGDGAERHGGTGDHRAEQDSEKRIEHAGRDGNAETANHGRAWTISHKKPNRKTFRDYFPTMN